MQKSTRWCLVVCGLLLSGQAAAQAAQNVVCNLCVHNTDLANNAITTTKIAAGGVTNADLAGSSVTSAKIHDGNVFLHDLSADVQAFLGGAIANITTLGASASAAGVAGVNCPSDRIPISASCSCDDANGSRNFGVLFSCAVAGTGAIAGCFAEAVTFNPGLPAPLAEVTAVCLGAASYDGTPWVPLSTGLVADSAASGDLRITSTEEAQWRMEQHAAYEAALMKIQNQRSIHGSRLLQRAQ